MLRRAFLRMASAAVVAATVGIESFRLPLPSLSQPEPALPTGGALTYEMLEAAYAACVSGSEQPTHYMVSHAWEAEVLKFYAVGG